MATYDLQEQEQLAEIKTWWRLHGTVVVLVLGALALGMVVWQGSKWWNRTQATEASQIYVKLQQAVDDDDANLVRQLSGELIGQYGSTAYAGMAALLSGKTLMALGDLKTAQAQFNWAAQNAQDGGLRQLARLRQAIVLADQEEYDDALKLLREDVLPMFAARYAEVRGDILVKQGKGGDAVKEYDAAIEASKQVQPDDADKMAPPVGYIRILQVKREAAAGVQS